MHVFVLVDLLSQCEYIPQSVRRWPLEKMLTWLKQHGEVREWTLRYGDGVLQSWYTFRSWWGIEHSFRFSEDGCLVIFLDHRVYKAWSSSVSSEKSA